MHFDGDKVVSEWIGADNLGLLIKLGVLDDPWPTKAQVPTDLRIGYPPELAGVERCSAPCRSEVLRIPIRAPNRAVRASALEMPDDGRRHTRYKGRRKDIVCDDCTGRHDGISSDVHAGKDRSGSSDPHIRIDRDRFRSDI